MPSSSDISPEPAHPPLKVCMLASGSRGNSIYISNGDTSVLVDAGLSGIEIERRMRLKRISIKKIDAIVVSHEHADHIQGVGVLARRYRIPVYISKKTRKTAAAQLGKIQAWNHFSCGSDFIIKGLTVRPFSVSHDAEDPAGFTIGCNGKKIGIATDLGVATAMVKEHLKGCCLLILEANHDVRMLEEGPYPWPVKQRIKSRTGHLSNESSKNLLMEVLHDKLSHVILAHLSETNNTPEQALSVIGSGLTRHQPYLTVASQDVPGPVIRF